VLEDVDFTDGRAINELDNALHGWVAADEANIMLTDAPEVKDSELQQAMRWKLKDNSEVNIKGSVIDCISIPGQRERGRQAMAYVVTASIDLLKSYVRVVEKSQLNLKSIDINALALRNIAHLLPEDKYGVAFLQLDPNSGSLSLSREGSLYLARDIDVGYQQIVSMGSPKNTSLKIEDSVEMQASLENIVLEVQRSLDYYERYFAQAPIQTLVLAPLPVEVLGMVEYISGQLGINVYELDLNDILTMNNLKLERGLQTKYLPAIGAALRFSYTIT